MPIDRWQTNLIEAVYREHNAKWGLWVLILIARHGVIGKGRTLKERCFTLLHILAVLVDVSVFRLSFGRFSPDLLDKELNLAMRLGLISK